MPPNLPALCLLLTMLLQTAHSVKIAVLGSGVAGATVARSLAERGARVTVFEAGRGVGGRTSTRITRDDAGYQFDHGGQYISAPKTDEFREALNAWKEDGWVRKWEGRFGSATSSGVELESDKKERWVGSPAMNAICNNLLEHDNISVELQTRANALFVHESDQRWDLIRDKTKKRLGSFDWLVATDRNSAAHHRRDVSSACVDDFSREARKIRSVRSLTAMVAFERPLGLGADGILFDPKVTDGAFGSLGWAARDTSKPGREREDGRECWVLQSHPAAAEEVLKGMRRIDQIREKAKDVLVSDFLRSLPALRGDGGAEEAPVVVHAVGHRWGAAFPVPTEEYASVDCQLIPDRRFVACGDYFGEYSGRIEGAYLSGISAADELWREVQR